MTEPDRDDMEIRAGQFVHGLHSAIFELCDMVSRGEGRFIDEAELITAQSQIGGLLAYLREHRKAA